MRPVVIGLAAVLMGMQCHTAMAAQSVDAEQMFNAQCAACHMLDAAPAGSPNEKAPTRTQLRSFPAEAVLAALTTGKMQLQAQLLNDAQKRQVSEYITGKVIIAAAGPVTVVNKCSFDRPMQELGKSASWNGHGNGPAATRFQNVKTGGITAADLPKLKLKWAFGYNGVAAARTQPAVAGGRLFVASENGEVHALDPATGCTFWTFRAQAGVRSAPAVAEYKSQGRNKYVVVVGDTKTNLYGIDADTGAQLWTIRVDQHPSAGISGSPIIHDGRVFIGVQGIGEEGRGNTGGYACCTFRGSLSAFDVATGTRLWQTFTIDEPQPRAKSPNGVQFYGPAGGAIWSAPSIDVKRGLVYAATGNGYADPPQAMTNAVIAFDQKTGKVRWHNQLTVADQWAMGCQTPQAAGTPGCPAVIGPDFDFSATPILATVGNRELIVLPQKSGIAFALDPAKNGELVWKTQFGLGSGLGGQWGGAVDGTNFYTGTNGFQSTPGGFTALKLTDGSIAWQMPPQPTLCGQARGCGAGQGAAATAIPGAVLSSSLDGGLRAYSTKDGQILWTFDTNRSFDTVNGVKASGGSMDGPGPIVVNGMLFVNSGYGGLVGRPGNVLLAFALE